MKKLYSLLCAVAVTALAANAAAPRFAAEKVGKAEFRAKAELAVKPTAAQKAQKAAKADAEEWTSLGNAQYRETLLADLFGSDEEVLTAELQQSKTDANKYQLVNLYKTWSMTKYTNITYDETADHNLVFHVSGSRVWLEGFDTGIEFTAQGATTSERFYIATQAAGIIEYNPTATLDQIAAAYTDVFGTYADGVITYPEGMTAVSSNKTYYNFLIEDMNTVEDGDYAIIAGGNVKNFAIAFPDKELPEPKPETWIKVGTAEYTDGALSSLFQMDVPAYEVDLEASEDRPGVYRLVNPYKNFPIKGTDAEGAIEYVDGDYYMVLHLEEATTTAPYIWIEDMEDTGIRSLMTGADAPTGEMNLYWQMAQFCEQYGLSAVVQVYGADAVGHLDPATWTITYPISFEAENKNGVMTKYYNQLVWVNAEGDAYTANTNGKFKIFLTPLYQAGVEDLEVSDADAPVEYFNLQGQRVAEPAAGLYIKRQGKTVSKVVIR